MKNEVIKAGTILFNKDGDIAIIYRKKLNDYTFPKGHLEKGESIIECAIRETEEETLRSIKIINKEPLGTLNYTDSKNIKNKLYFYLAEDKGVLNRTILDKDREDMIWINKDKVLNILTYQNLKDFYKSIKNIIDFYVQYDDTCYKGQKML